jgi:hypothetical protein
MENFKNHLLDGLTTIACIDHTAVAADPEITTRATVPNFIV